jgi:hypothetical protein
VTSKVLSVDAVVRSLIDKIRPHILHQSQWANKGVGIYCKWCETYVFTVTDFSAIKYFKPDAQDRIKVAVARWIGNNSTEEAKLTFRL